MELEVKVHAKTATILAQDEENVWLITDIYFCCAYLIFEIYFFLKWAAAGLCVSEDAGAASTSRRAVWFALYSLSINICLATWCLKVNFLCCSLREQKCLRVNTQPFLMG